MRRPGEFEGFERAQAPGIVDRRWRTKTLERFWSKVDRNGPAPSHRPDLGPCWLWTASTTPNGYGQFHSDVGTRVAHIVSWQLVYEPIPIGMVFDHLCRVPRCVRPSHLEPVAESVNFRRGIHPNAIAHATNRCAKGLHDLAGDNVIFDARGYRRCRQCARDGARRRYDPVRAHARYLRHRLRAR